MNAGYLDKRIVIQAKTVTRDSFGGETIVYSDLATVWANIKAVSGREYYLAKQVNSEVEFEITIRYRTDVNPTRRLKYSDSTGERYFDIKSALDKDMRRKYLTLMCSEVK